MPKKKNPIGVTGVRGKGGMSAQERAKAVSKKLGTGGVGQAASAIRARRAAEKELLGN
jgi:hypothetical protein